MSSGYTGDELSVLLLPDVSYGALPGESDVFGVPWEDN